MIVVGHIAGRGLNPDILERPFPEQAPVRHAVQGHPAREAQVILARRLPRKPGHAENDLLGHRLD